MKDVLEQIVADKRIELAQQKIALPASELYKEVDMIMQSFDKSNKRSFKDALTNSATGIIAEFKRKSPSKGWIKEEGNPLEVTRLYQENGASAISILTDNKYFGGSLNYIEQVRQIINIPILRKDFIIDEYQLYQARKVGADVVLLIAADLSVNECKHLIEVAHKLELEVLLEIHSNKELEYAALDVDAIGVNNRNLGTFITDVNNSFKLAEQLPEDVVKVSESGLSNAQTIKQLRQAGYNGFLMGEQFMKNINPGDALKYLISEINN